MRILLIDDEVEILSLLKDTLESFGYEVETALDGEMGVDMFKESINNGKKFDLLIIDYRMYGKDGLQVSKEVMDIDKNTKILFASADPSIKKKVIEMGAVGFLLKPFTIRELIDTIKNISSRNKT